MQKLWSDLAIDEANRLIFRIIVSGKSLRSNFISLFYSYTSCPLFIKIGRRTSFSIRFSPRGEAPTIQALQRFVKKSIGDFGQSTGPGLIAT